MGDSSIDVGLSGGLTQEDLDPKQEEKRAKDDAADIVEEIISLAASSESAHDRLRLRWLA